jgi:subfamily B ATP-binding cassette protein HlyB/CyaB
MELEPAEASVAPHGNGSGGAAADVSQPVDPGLVAVCLIGRLHHVAADPASLAHALGQGRSERATTRDLLLAARHVGLKARLSRCTAERLSLTPLPALALMADGRAVLLAQCDGKRVLFMDPYAAHHPGPTGLTSASTHASVLPTIEPLETFAAAWSGQLILVASRASLAGALARFDFSWFIPSIVKYRRLFGEVLVVSLFLQLFALVSPLFFQVVMDKVLVHHGLTTLDVLVIGLAIVVVFESLLTALRTYVFSHTTSRIDVELGARLFRHLVSLPLAYFQARRVGDSVARVRELENIRSFLTGNSLTLVLDVLFSVVFIGVMFAYSVPLTLIVLVSLPLYATLSAALVPILRARLDEKFARGAENQALLVETVTGIQTVKAGALEPALAKRWDDQLAAYILARGYGTELVQENDATAGNTDVMRFLAGIADNQIWFRHAGNDLEVSIIGTTDKATVQNWYLGAQYHAEQFATADGHVLLDANVQNLVDAMAAFAPPGAGQTTLPPAYRTVLDPVIVANWGP